MTDTGKPTIFEALASVMGDVREVRKRERNTDQNYAFRGVDTVMNAVGPALRRHGVIVAPNCEEMHWRDVTTSRGKPSRECTVRVRFRFYGPAGDHIDCVTPGESMDFGDKGAPKAMAVAFRTALLQTLCLPTDDVESDAATYERGAPAGPHRNGAAGQREGSEPASQPDQPAASSGAAAAALRFVRNRAEREGIPWDDVRVRYAQQFEGEVIDDGSDPNRLTAFAKLLVSNGAGGER